MHKSKYYYKQEVDLGKFYINANKMHNKKQDIFDYIEKKYDIKIFPDDEKKLKNEESIEI